MRKSKDLSLFIQNLAKIQYVQNGLKNSTTETGQKNKKVNSL